MRIRLVLIAVAFAVLAFAGLRGDDTRSLEPRNAGTSCELAAQPDSDIDPPAIVRAAVATPSAPQTHFDVESLRHTRLVDDAWTFVREARTQPDSRVSSPRTFPLLI